MGPSSGARFLRDILFTLSVLVPEVRRFSLLTRFPDAAHIEPTRKRKEVCAFGNSWYILRGSWRPADPWDTTATIQKSLVG
jgi:hypothetical protein